MEWEDIGLYSPGDLSAHGITDIAIEQDGADLLITGYVRVRVGVRIGAGAGFAALPLESRVMLTGALVGALVNRAKADVNHEPEDAAPVAPQPPPPAKMRAMNGAQAIAPSVPPPPPPPPPPQPDLPLPPLVRYTEDDIRVTTVEKARELPELLASLPAHPCEWGPQFIDRFTDSDGRKMRVVWEAGEVWKQVQHPPRTQ